MTIILYLLAISLCVAACGLGFFLWSLRSGQYDDLDGAANRILYDDDIAVAAPVRPPLEAASVRPGPDAPERRVRDGTATRV
jgi:cbb3-type cytochrome oxidase maturation protein